jgi:hypothetical protein
MNADPNLNHSRGKSGAELLSLNVSGTVVGTGTYRMRWSAAP